MNTASSTPESYPENQLQSNLEALPLVDRLFVDEHASAEIIREAVLHILPDEHIFAIFQLNASHNFVRDTDDSGNGEKAPLWTVVTGTRLLLLAVSSQGQTYCDIFKQDTVVEYLDGLARDEIRIAGRTITTGIWEGKRKLFKAAISLFPLPEYEKYLHVAGVYLNNEQYSEALPFLQASLACEPTIKAYLLQAYAFSRTGTPDKAIDVLQQACNFADPAAIITEIQRLFADNLVMFLYLAVVCENNQWWEHGLSIYLYLQQKTPDFDLYLLKLGELHNWKREYAKAVEYYQAFIQQRRASSAPDGGDFIHWDLSDLKCFGADPDLMKAYFDLALIYEQELRDQEQALTYYLSLIRHAPLYIDAYQHFWKVYQQLLASHAPLSNLPPFNLSMFLQVYRLLDPQNYAETVHTQDLAGLSETSAIPEHANFRSPDYRPLDEREHDLLTHPGELEYWHKVQNWITSLVVSDSEEQGIEQYCEQVSHSNYPQFSRVIERVSQFMDITPPRGFVSRGKIGISVKNKEHPFIFIGSEHLNAESDRYFSEQELVFIIAGQTEHIKSGHILITGTELWKSLGSASFDGFLVALQFLPAGSFLGRLTHHFATEGLKRVYKMTQYSSIQKVLKFLAWHGTGRSAADEADVDNIGEERRRKRSQSSMATESEAKLREELVDFARHAVYKADRVGVLACHDIQAACSAVFKLAGDAYDALKPFEREGLLALVSTQDKREKYVYFEYAKRLSELIQFVLSDTYQRLYENLLVDTTAPQAAPPPLSAHALSVKKLTLLEQSRQNDLLTEDEFFLKQHHVFTGVQWLSTDDLALLQEYQQACRNGVLTYEELHAKIVHYLEQGMKNEEMER